MKKRKVGPGRPRMMSEFLRGSAVGGHSSSSSQTSTMSRHPPSPATVQPPPPPPPPPPPELPEPQPAPETAERQQTVIRGHNKGVPEWNTGVKIQVIFNEKFQPVGDRASQLKSQLGIMVRDRQRVPLTYLDWKAVDDSIKQGIWTEVKNNLLDVPEDFRVVCLKICNQLWKDHKGKTKEKYFEKNQDDPELSSKVPPHIVREQWPVLVAYWRSEDAKAIAMQNSSNREMHGPLHVTGRKSFAQIRYDMEKSGQPVDKMGVWIKARNPNDHDVVEVIKDYEHLLSKEPEDQRQLTVVKDRIFHIVIGPDGHGYCRTYGSSAPRTLVYPSDPSAPNSTADLIQKITEEVTQKVTKEVTEKVTKDVTETLLRQFELKYDQMNARLMDLESNDGRSSNSLVQGATSGHPRESVGDGAHLLTSDEQCIATKEGAAKGTVQEEEPSEEA